MNLVKLDPSGNPTGTPYTGSIVDTSALASGHTPAAGYFAPITMYPSYKNHTNASAPADNTCYQVVAGTPTQRTLTVNVAPGGSGSVIKFPNKATYNNGESVQLTAVPAAGYAFSNWSGDLSGSANPATITMDGDKTVTANFVVAVCSDVTLYTVKDNWLRASQATTNYGGATTLSMNPNGTNSQFALLQWDLSSIPANATINTANLTFYVTDVSPNTYYLYDLKRSWVEGTGTTDSTPSTTSSNWNTTDGVTTWGTGGAQDTTSDRNSTNLWGAGTSTFTSLGDATVALNTSGVGVVQGWYNTPASNFGLTIQNPATASDYLIIASKEAATEAQRPRLNINYCIPQTGPTITTGGTLTAFSSQPGVPSAAQTYSVAGSNLTDSILITPPSGFELSTDGTNYYPSLTLNQSGGSVGTTTIHVRLNSATEGTPSGNIVHSSAGATAKNIAASGTVLYVYTLTAGNDGHGSVTLSPAGGSYNNGTTVTLTPVPNTGFKFSNWSGDNALQLTDLGNGSYTILMNGNKTVSANFAAKAQYALTTAVSPEGTGSITLNPSGGTYYEGDVVTLTAAPGSGSGYAFSSWTGHLTGSTNPTTLIMDGDKFVTAIFTVAPTCTTVNLEAADDNYISSYSTSTTNNYGASTTLKVTRNASSAQRGSLFKWNVSSIPSGATVSSASLTLYVSTAASQVYNLYNMRRSWVEGTGASSESGDGATWLTYDGTNTWMTSGAANTSADRYDTNLWGAGTSSFSSTGSKTVSLNTDGIAVVEGWIAGTTSNYGLTMQNYSSTSVSDDLQFASSENTTYAGPTLNISYCTGGTPNYTLTMSNDGHGTVTLDPVGPTYTAGTVVTLTPAPASGYEFATWTGTNAEDPSDNGTGTWSLTMNSNKSIQANFTLLPVNVAPNQPVLVQPLDNATGVATPPTLKVTASDPNTTDTNLSVSFYGRPVGATTGEDFRVVVIPDPQNYATSYPTVYTNHLQWIATNKTSSNIVFATAVGDLVNTATSTTEYGHADTAFDTLDAGGVAYSVSPGNHDYSLTNYNVYFGTSRFSGKSWYQGYTGTGNENNYSFFSASGNDFILINLGYNPSTTYMNWADALLKANPTKRGIVVSHSIINIDNSWTYETLYTNLKDNPNLFLMLCGHMHSSSDGAAYRAELGDDGHTIHIVQADYQDFPGSGYLRILRFSPANDKIYATTYSPITSGSLTSYPDQMEMVYDLASGSSAAYTLIGTTTTTNGGDASVIWGERSDNTEYEWYATVSDGTETVTGPTWSFTTGTGNSAPTDISLSNSSVAENQSANTPVGALSTTDPDTGNTFTYSLVSGAGDTDNASFNISGDSLRTSAVFDYETKSSYAIRVRTTDQGGLYTEKTFTVAVSDVNDAPVLGAIGNRSVNELVLLTFTATAIDANLPPQTLTFSLANGTSGAVPTGAAIDGSSGVFTWTPTEAQGPGVYTFDVCVSDGTASDCEMISVTVSEVNVAPVITEGDSVNVTMTKNGVPTPFSLILHATDADGGDTLTWSISTAAGQGTASASGTGLTKDIGYTPGTDYVGSDSFVVQVSDGNGGTDTITVNVTIQDVHSISIALVAGWNLVSFNVHPVDTDIANVLASISGNYNLVYAWVDGTWQHYDPAQPFGNTLVSLDESMGFWVQMTTPGTLIVTGTAPSTSGIALKAGWNLVSFPGATSQTLPEAFTLNDVDLTNLNLVTAMHADMPADPWLLYDPIAPNYVNDLTELTPGWGYWISVVSDDTWTVP